MSGINPITLYALARIPAFRDPVKTLRVRHQAIMNVTTSALILFSLARPVGSKNVTAVFLLSISGMSDL